MARNMQTKKEEIQILTRKVSCVGLEHPYDHPKIYLEIPEDKNQIDCPYCGKLFKYSTQGKK